MYVLKYTGKIVLLKWIFARERSGSVYNKSSRRRPIPSAFLSLPFVPLGQHSFSMLGPNLLICPDRILR